MRGKRVWQRLLGLRDTVVEAVAFHEESQVVVVSVRPRQALRHRCGRCGKRAPLYDRGEGTRRWRCLDVGELRCYLEAHSPRVSCPLHGPTVVGVPWARHGAGHTRAFDDQVAWLASCTSKSAVTDLMRVAWRTVGSIVTRVIDDATALTDPLDGLVRIGIDEISYKRGHKYMTVIVDHDTRRLVWAYPGKDKAALRKFFCALGPERSKRITLVSGDAAPYIELSVFEHCPNAQFCTDPFHVVSWATRALDAVRRQAWSDARRHKDPVRAKVVKGSRWALLKNPEALTDKQRSCLELLEAINHETFRAYLLKEQLRAVFKLRGPDAVSGLGAWIDAACASDVDVFVDLGYQIRANRDGIENALKHGLSNGIVESVNTKIRLLLRVGFGFHSPQAVIALAMLALGGYRPPLPGRPRRPHANRRVRDPTLTHG